jgi:hypothetical protein
VKGALIAVFLLLCVLHQDIWFWRTAHPIVFGFLPIGLAYHALFTIAVAVFMALLVKYAWPTHLERDSEDPKR